MNKFPETREKLIVALDFDSDKQALELARQLQPHVGMFKVGMQLFYSAGPDIVRRLKEQGVKIFLDLKLHDIPNTVAKAARALIGLGADIINVHAAGGEAMLRQAAEAVREQAAVLNVQAPKIIAVTVLTSIDLETFNEQMGINGSIVDRVKAWSLLAKQSGLDGVVASAKEIAVIRENCGKDFQIITPGIRPLWSATGDQKRIMTPTEAIKLGADYLVVGRPITGSEDPAQAAERVLSEIAEGL